MNLSPQQLLLLLAVLCVGALLRVANLDNVGIRTPDEFVYTRQANVWLHSGGVGLRSMAANYEADTVARLYPPPTRVGMIRLVAVFMRLTGRNNVSVGALLSSAASIASLSMVALIAIRFLPAVAALVSVLFFAVFPPELAIARRTWADAPAELASLLLIWLACEITRDSRRRVWYLLFAATGGASVAIKESMCVPFGVCGLWLLFILLRKREWKNVLLLTSAAIVALLATLAWIAGLVGGFPAIVRMVSGIPAANARNPYAIVYASGPGYWLLQAFWYLSPVTTLLGGVGAYGVLSRREQLGRHFLPALFILLFTLSHIAIAMLVPHWLNLRYVGMTFGTVCLLAGLGAWSVYSTFSRSLGGAQRRILAGVAAAILIGTAATDYKRFQRTFVQHGTTDLSVGMLHYDRYRR